MRESRSAAPVWPVTVSASDGVTISRIDVRVRNVISASSSRPSSDWRYSAMYRFGPEAPSSGGVPPLPRPSVRVAR